MSAAKVAIVTGAGSGIGKAAALALAEAGYSVTLAGRRADKLEEVAGEAGEASLAVPTDVTDPESVRQLFAATTERFGRLDLLFNNAGVGSGGGGKAWTNEPNDWKWCFGVNVFGSAHGVISFVPRMIESGQPGHVVNTSSGDGGFAPVPMASVYASSKAAVSCFTEALHHQLLAEAEGMGASVFYPSGGLMNTGLFTAQRNRPEHLQRVRGGTGRARFSPTSQ